MHKCLQDWTQNDTYLSLEGGEKNNLNFPCYYISVSYPWILNIRQNECKTSSEFGAENDLFWSAGLKMVFLMKLMSPLETETQMDEPGI